MKRISDISKQADKFGSGKHGYTEGTPGLVSPSRIRADAMDHLQEELANAIEDDRAIDSASHRQLADVLGEWREKQGVEAVREIDSSNVRAIAFSGWGVDGVGICGASGLLGYVGEEVADVQTVSAAASYTGSFECILWTDGVAVAAGGPRFVCGGASGALQMWAPSVAASKVTLAGSYTGTVRGLADNGSGTLVLVGDSGMIQTIINGTGPTTRTPAGGFSGTFYDVAWASGLGLFVAVGNDGGTPEIQTSPNGITWTARSAPAGLPSGLYLAHVAYHEEGGLIAFGDNGSGSSAVLKSANGTSWTDLALPATTLGSVGAVCTLKYHFAIGARLGASLVLIPYRDVSKDALVKVPWTIGLTPYANGMCSAGTRVYSCDGASLFGTGRIG